MAGREIGFQARRKHESSKIESSQSPILGDSKVELDLAADYERVREGRTMLEAEMLATHVSQALATFPVAA